MITKILKVAENLHAELSRKSEQRKLISIFLCGGNSPDQSKKRRALGRTISSARSKYRYPVFYPEHLFLDILLGHEKHDLLSLENILAESVTAVVIYVESAGTFAELGAFVNYPKLADKLIVVTDIKYKKAKSFINQGPLNFIQQNTRSKIIYHDFQDTKLLPLANLIRANSREIAQHSEVLTGISNPLYTYGFILVLIYVLSPVRQDILLQVIEQIDGKTVTAQRKISAKTAINALVSEGKVTSGMGGLATTAKGFKYISDSISFQYPGDLESLLNNLRIVALNTSLRKQNRKNWGQARLS